MAKNNNLTDFLTDIADGIRAKKGSTELINPQNFRTEIESIETGIDTSDADAVSTDILSGKTAYVNGQKITGSIESIEANTYIPTTTDQIIGANKYLAGGQTIKGDSNLVSGNIKAGVEIFGVNGTYECEVPESVPSFTDALVRTLKSYPISYMTVNISPLMTGSFVVYYPLTGVYETYTSTKAFSYGNDFNITAIVYSCGLYNFFISLPDPYGGSQEMEASICYVDMPNGKIYAGEKGAPTNFFDAYEDRYDFSGKTISISSASYGSGGYSAILNLSGGSTIEIQTGGGIIIYLEDASYADSDMPVTYTFSDDAGYIESYNITDSNGNSVAISDFFTQEVHIDFTL